jgi:hypothetical protein
VFVESFCIGAQLVARKADALPEYVSSFSIAILLEINFTGAVNPLLSRRPVAAVAPVMESAENGSERTPLQYHCRIGTSMDKNCSSTTLYGRSRIEKDTEYTANGNDRRSDGEEYGCS